MVRLESGFVGVVHFVMADLSQASLVADDDTLVACPFARKQAAPLDHVFDTDWLVVDRSDDQGADVADAAFLFGEGSWRPPRDRSSPRPCARVFAAAEQATLRTVSATCPWSR